MTETLWKCACCDGTQGTMQFAKHELDTEWSLVCTDCLDQLDIHCWYGNFTELGGHEGYVRPTPYTPADIERQLLVEKYLGDPLPF